MLDAGTYGAISWVDLSTPDLETSLNFYEGVLGWKFNHQDSPMGTYYVANCGEFEVAGMMEQAPAMRGRPPSWTSFIYVKDAEQTTQAAALAGGRVDQPAFEIPGGAHVAVISDPTGAMIALISGGEETPHGPYLSADPGRVCWFELMTRDSEAADDFYRAVCDWEPTQETLGDGRTYHYFTIDGQMLAGMLDMPAEIPDSVPAHWNPYFAVEDCSALEQVVIDHGGTVEAATRQIGPGHFAVVADPTGAVFCVMDSRVA